MVNFENILDLFYWENGIIEMKIYYDRRFAPIIINSLFKYWYFINKIIKLFIKFTIFWVLHIFLVFNLFLFVWKVVNFWWNCRLIKQKYFLDKYGIPSSFVTSFIYNRYFNHLINWYFEANNWNNHPNLKNIDDAKWSNFLILLTSKKVIMPSIKRFFKNSKLF